MGVTPFLPLQKENLKRKLPPLNHYCRILFCHKNKNIRVKLNHLFSKIDTADFFLLQFFQIFTKRAKIVINRPNVKNFVKKFAVDEASLCGDQFCW